MFPAPRSRANASAGVRTAVLVAAAAWAGPPSPVHGGCAPNLLPGLSSWTGVSTSACGNSTTSFCGSPGVCGGAATCQMSVVGAGTCCTASVNLSATINPNPTPANTVFHFEVSLALEDVCTICGCCPGGVVLEVEFLSGAAVVSSCRSPSYVCTQGVCGATTVMITAQLDCCSPASYTAVRARVALRGATGTAYVVGPAGCFQGACTPEPVPTCGEVVYGAACCGCVPPTATPTTTPSPTVTTTETVTASGTHTGTATTTPSGSWTVTATISGTSTPSGSRTASGTTTPSSSRTGTRTPSATRSGSATGTATVSGTGTASATATASGSDTHTETASATWSATESGTPTESGSHTETATPTETGTFSETWTPTRTRSTTPTPSPTATESGTESPTSTASATFVTPSESPTVSETASQTPVAPFLAVERNLVDASGWPLGVRFAVANESEVRLAVFNSAGEQVQELYRGPLAAYTVRSVRWYGQNGRGEPVSSNVYVLRLRAVRTDLSAKVGVRR